MGGETSGGEPAESETSGGEPVVVALNAELCIGVGNCELLHPDHFRVDDDTAVAERIGDGVLSRSEAEQVVDRCPSGALTITSRP